MYECMFDACITLVYRRIMSNTYNETHPDPMWLKCVAWRDYCKKDNYRKLVSIRVTIYMFYLF